MRFAGFLSQWERKMTRRPFGSESRDVVRAICGMFEAVLSAGWVSKIIYRKEHHCIFQQKRSGISAYRKERQALFLFKFKSCLSKAVKLNIHCEVLRCFASIIAFSS